MLVFLSERWCEEEIELSEERSHIDYWVQLLVQSHLRDRTGPCVCLSSAFLYQSLLYKRLMLWMWTGKHPLTCSWMISRIKVTKGHCWNLSCRLWVWDRSSGTPWYLNMNPLDRWNATTIPKISPEFHGSFPSVSILIQKIFIRILTTPPSYYTSSHLTILSHFISSQLILSHLTILYPGPEGWRVSSGLYIYTLVHEEFFRPDSVPLFFIM